LCTARESEPLRPKPIHRITKRFLPDFRVNFRKAGANYSPLQQNHPNRSIKRRLNPLEKAPPPNQAIRQQAPVNS
jgi:hypothetical protein